MPVMNGYEAAKMIRSLDREDAKVVPIIANDGKRVHRGQDQSKGSGNG